MLNRRFDWTYDLLRRVTIFHVNEGHFKGLIWYVRVILVCKDCILEGLSYQTTKFTNSWKAFQGSPDQRHFITGINVRKRRIRDRTTLHLNKVVSMRIWIVLEIHHSIVDPFYVGSASFRHWFSPFESFWTLSTYPNAHAKASNCILETGVLAGWYCYHFQLFYALSFPLFT